MMAARREGRLLAAARNESPRDLDEAYALQDELLTERLAAGEHLVGWKIGYASDAMRRQMGIDRPNYGPLTDRMLLQDGGQVETRLVQPRVEPEIAVVLAQEVAPDAARADVAACVQEVRAALEVVDSIWCDYKFTIEQNTADGSSAAHAVLGPPVPGGADLSGLAVVLDVDGKAVHRGLGASAMGHPFDAVSWLAHALQLRGRRLGPGSLVLTGGLTPSVSLSAGSTVSGHFAGCGYVGVRRSAERAPPNG